MSGEICNCNDIFVLRVAKGQGKELCFKMADRNFECVNVT